MWPSMAAPAVALVQFLQVRSSLPAKARPSGCDPVSASCMLGVSPRPLTTPPFSLSDVCLVRLLLALCRSSTPLATTSPLALLHGPLPMRSRALIAGSPAVAPVLRYACHVWPPAPAEAARSWQCLSAPASPPRSAPLPTPALVTKNVMRACCACALAPSRTSAVEALRQRRAVVVMSCSSLDLMRH